jgi:hypothetical protein
VAPARHTPDFTVAPPRRLTMANAAAGGLELMILSFIALRTLRSNLSKVLVEKAGL